MKMGKLFAGLSAAALAASCFAFSAFADADAEVTMNSFEPSAENVKIIGRAKYIDSDYLWFGATGAGVEFTFDGRYAEIDFNADGNGYSTDNPIRYRYFVDGNAPVYDLVTEKETQLKIDGVENGTHTVRFEKVSESENGTMRITEIKADAENIAPAADKSHKIEFIGDSITCGYGVDGEYGKDTFTTKNEDGTKTYAYKASQILDADYSMFSFSGFGVYSGYPDGGKRNTTSTIEQYYESLGMSWWSDYQWDHQLKDEAWDFEQFTPELVVINLGTNDNSYRNAAKDVENKTDIDPLFVDAYVSLLKKVRSCNPDAEILCTYGIMGDEIKELIQKAADNYYSETGDDKINVFFFPVQDQEKDGVAVDWHPSDLTHSKDAILLAEKINELYGWELDAEKYPDVPADEPEDSSSVEDSSSSDDTSSDDTSSTEDSSSEADSSSASSSETISFTTSSKITSTTFRNGSTTATTTTTTTTASGSDTSPTTGVKSAAAAVSVIALGALVAVRKKKK